MDIKFVDVNKKNIALVSQLHVSKAQENMVETVAESFKEAELLSLWKPIAIKDGNTMIGFAMYGLWQNEGDSGKVWLDRFFIDEHYQGKNYSKVVLPILLNKIATQYRYPKIYLSVYENNTVAINLYKSFGFLFNGDLDINREKVMVLNTPIDNN